MNEDFVSIDLAKKLKEKGFKEECLCHYISNDIVYNIESPIANNQMWFCHNKYDNIWHRDNIDAPTISQVLKWLREEKRIAINIEFVPHVWQYHIFDMSFEDRFKPCGKTFYEKYEEAAVAGIEYVLDNLI